MRHVVLLTALCLGTPVLADPGDGQGAVELAQAAIERGYGTKCSLSNVPVDTAGYWPCLDVGPYRFVSEYGRVRVFVVLDGQAPFPILVSSSGRSDFLVQGPWTTDLDARVSAWWEDEAQGNRVLREGAESDARRRSAAEDLVRRSGNRRSGSEGDPPTEPVRPSSPSQAPGR